MSALDPVGFLPLILVAVAALTYIVREALELTGRSPGAELLRVENGDLVRRNQELEAAVGRLESQVTEMRTKIRDLEMTNQAAVLAALTEHEKGAKERHAITTGLLERAVTALEGES